MTRLEGVLTALVTPFSPTGDLSVPELRRQVERQVSYGNGIFCGGTNGEFFSLHTAEKFVLARECVEAAAGRVPVVAHVGAITPAATIALGRDVAALDVDAISVITPWLVPLRQDELVEHFSRIADAIDKPIYLYNIPPFAKNRLEPETVATLAQHGNIRGIKDSSGDWDSIARFLDVAKESPDFKVMSGPDHLAREGFMAGCSACVSGLANLVPHSVNLIWSRFKAGDSEGSLAAQDVVSALRAELHALGFAPAAVKKALSLAGENVGSTRHVSRFSLEATEQIRRIVDKYFKDAEHG